MKTIFVKTVLQDIKMENAKKIIATFLKKDSSEITETTVMDRTAIPGSILLHRMYSTLASEGFNITNQNKIKTYGDFVNTLNAIDQKPIENQPISKEVTSRTPLKSSSTDFSIGIDLEEIANMPIVTDYRENKFYIDTFSAREISHCILQADPRGSFAGKFALKEAIIKADNFYQMIPFKEIEILNNTSGKPIFSDFALSISHTDTHAVAVASKGSFQQVIPIQREKQLTRKEIEQLVKNSTPNISNNQNLNYFSLVLSLIAITMVVFFNFTR